jgi:hypothetical protein
MAKRLLWPHGHLRSNLASKCRRYGRFGRRLPLRTLTSPLVTAADTAMLIIKHVWLTLRGIDLRSAARIVWEDPVGGPGWGIDATWGVSMGCFVLGTLMQSVKLLACIGIPWTQAITGICLASFVLFELLRVLAHPAHAVDLSMHTTSISLMLTMLSKEFNDYVR